MTSSPTQQQQAQERPMSKMSYSRHFNSERRSSNFSIQSNANSIRGLRPSTRLTNVPIHLFRTLKTSWIFDNFRPPLPHVKLSTCSNKSEVLLSQNPYPHWRRGVIYGWPLFFLVSHYFPWSGAVPMLDIIRLQASTTMSMQILSGT